MTTILYGLIGLSVVVIVHEFGHFLVARASGVHVEAFSIGWGPPLLKFKRGMTEWRLGILPIGGYCKLKGEDSFRKAIEEKLPQIPSEDGGFYSAHPLRRISIALAGPVSNMLFAIIAFSLVAAIGITIQTAPNRIILSSETGSFITQDRLNPADEAGLETGDIILSVEGKNIRDYRDLQDAIATNPGKPLRLEVLRNGMTRTLVVTPRLDPNTGAGVIGVYAYIEPLVGSVKRGSPAEIADIRPGDRITQANGIELRNSVDFLKLFSEGTERLDLTIERNGQLLRTTLVAQSAEEAGIAFEGITRTEKAHDFLDAMARGASETASTFAMTFKSIGLLFRGVNVFKAVSGPARITWMIGTAAQDQIKENGLAGLVPILSFLAFLSVGLAIVNLLPLPVLDGGLIILFLAELLKRKPLSPKTVYRYQFIGAAFVIVIFIVATMSDIVFFTGK
ncbi:MAG: RIP metalloprotease RseP [Rectinema sp.]|nr:RIP metalloprotease RseP [Rectinema sp.]